jgi:hypothetical protein
LPSSSDTAWVGVSNCRTATPNGCPSTTVLRTTGPWLDLGTGDARAPRWHRWRRSLPKAAWAVAGGSDGLAPSPRRRSSIRPTAAKAGNSARTLRDDGIRRALVGALRQGLRRLRSLYRPCGDQPPAEGLVLEVLSLLGSRGSEPSGRAGPRPGPTSPLHAPCSTRAWP